MLKLEVIICRQAIEHPVRTNQIPRQIPEQSMYIRTVPGVLMGGILPFGCIFIQLFFILNSIWSVDFLHISRYFGFTLVDHVDEFRVA